MIITHHILVYEFGLKDIAIGSLPNKGWTYFQLLVDCFVVIGVNTFVFISGYFGINFKLSTVTSLVLQAVFYGVSIILIYHYFNPNENWHLALLHAFIPVSSNTWWFLSSFLGLYFISPFLNKGVDLIESSQFKILLIGFLFFDCFAGFVFGTFSGNGYSTLHFITLYLLARFIKVNNFTFTNSFLYLCLLTLTLFACVVVVLNFDIFSFLWKPFGHTKFTVAWNLFNYNNPILIVSSVMLFFVFDKFNMKISHIKHVSGAVFGVYLIHESNSVRNMITQIVSKLHIEYSALAFIFSIISLIISIFIISTLIELARKYLEERMISNIRTMWKNQIVKMGAKNNLG